MTSDKAPGFVLRPARTEKERGRGARAHCIRGDSSPRVPEMAPGTRRVEGGDRALGNGSPWGPWGQRRPCSDKAGHNLRCDMSGAELNPLYVITAQPACRASQASHPISWGGGPPSLDVPEGGHIIVYRFLEFRLIHSGLLLCAVGPRASL